MAVNLKAELTRPLALILVALAALGWVLFALTSWSAASTQKAQRLRIADLTEKRDVAVADLSKQMQASGALADLQAKVANVQQDLTRVTQTRSDVQGDLSVAQKNLANARRELTEADRSLQNQKLADVQSSADGPTPSADEGEAETARPAAHGGRRAGRYHRHRRSYAVRRSR